MKTDIIRVLLVDDDEDDYVITRDYLQEIETRTFEIDWAPSFEEGLKNIRQRVYHIMFFDYLLGARTGIDLDDLFPDWFDGEGD